MKSYDHTVSNLKETWNRIDEGHTQLESDLTNFKESNETEVTGVLDHIENQVSEWMERHNEKLDDASQRSEEALSVVGEAFYSAVSQQVDETIGDVKQTIESVQSTFDETVGGALQEVESVSESIDEIVGMVEKIEPVLDLVKALL